MTAERYLKENIDEQLTIKLWLKTNNFPIFLRDSYNLLNDNKRNLDL